jgi:hypothetical protein
MVVLPYKDGGFWTEFTKYVGLEWAEFAKQKII